MLWGEVGGFINGRQIWLRSLRSVDDLGWVWEHSVGRRRAVGLRGRHVVVLRVWGRIGIVVVVWVGTANIVIMLCLVGVVVSSVGLLQSLLLLFCTVLRGWLHRLL